MIAEGVWETTDPLASDDDVVNIIRESIARRGYQVGDCVITERNHTEGLAHVEVYEEISGEFEWMDVKFRVDLMAESSKFLGGAE